MNKNSKSTETLDHRILLSRSGFLQARSTGSYSNETSLDRATVRLTLSGFEMITYDTTSRGGQSATTATVKVQLINRKRNSIF